MLELFFRFQTLHNDSVTVSYDLESIATLYYLLPESVYVHRTFYKKIYDFYILLLTWKIPFKQLWNYTL